MYKEIARYPGNIAVVLSKDKLIQSRNYFFICYAQISYLKQI